VIETASVYEACGELFTNFPLAARDMDVSGTIRSMVLMLRDSDGPQFFVLAQGCRDSWPVYSLCQWPAGDIVDVAPGLQSVPDTVASAVIRGVPLPRHGSIFGCADRSAFSALLIVYTDSGPTRPLPSWSVMPLAGLPEARWPPFTGPRLFGPWFWDAYRAGSVVALDDLIARSPGSVFWVDTQTILDSDCCAVARDLTDPAGRTLRRGRYVYSEALRAGRPVPSLTALLADAEKLDLAPRFQALGATTSGRWQ
jgi:hypothetical protein